MRNKLNNEKSLLKDKNLYIIFSVTLIAMMGIASTAPAYPTMAKVMNLDMNHVGILISLFTLPGVFLAPILGIMADRFGRKAVIVPAMLLFGLAGALCAFANSYMSLALLFFIQGIGASPLGALNVALIGDVYGDDRRIKAVGYNSSVLNIGTAAYPIIGGILAGLSWRAPFLLPAVSIILAFVFWKYLDLPFKPKKSKLSDYYKETATYFKNGEILLILLFCFVSYLLLFGPLITFLPFIIKSKFNMPPVLIGVYLSTMSLTAAAFSSSVAKFVIKRSYLRVISLAFVLYGLGSFGFGFAPSPILLALCVVAYGIGHGLNMPNIYSKLAGSVDAEHRGAIMSINRMIGLLGQTLGPVFFNFLNNNFGYNSVFIAALSLSIMLSILAFAKSNKFGIIKTL